MISVDGLTKSFGDQKVLDGISLQVKQGEIVTLLGMSGSGKSVLLLHLVGLMTPDSGRITIDGAEITDLSESKLLKFRKNIGYLFQDGALYDFMTVAENLAFPLKEAGKLRRADIGRKVVEYLKLVDMPEAADKYPSELSGGMRKRAALARALIMDAKVLLCDEPTSGLDPIRSRDIALLIRDLSRKMGTTTLMTSHDITNTFRVSERVFVLNEGRIAVQGVETGLRRSADPFVREFLGS
jgi:phospholipid/cholesterol/gamma-HCH transport system ATP-binding protein